MKIVVIDYQLGNISSIINMLKKIGVDAIHSSDVNAIRAADKLILPGVGAFDHGMQNLRDTGLIEVLNEVVLQDKKPILGICLGMQLLLENSEEGQLNGLGWIKGKCIRFSFAKEEHHLKIPHMGWNEVKLKREKNFLHDANNRELRYYFVHSYHAVCQDEENIIGVAHHGFSFPAIIQHGHILGAQFHPEKSHQFGMQFLKKFVELKNYA